MWGDYYPEDDRRTPYFEVEAECPRCGTRTYRRNDGSGSICRCGTQPIESYSNSDAVRWNRWVNRGGR